MSTFTTYKIKATAYSAWRKSLFAEEADAQLLASGTGPCTRIGLDMGAFEKGSCLLLSKFLPRSSPQKLVKLYRYFLAVLPEAAQPLRNSDRILNDSDSARQSRRIGAILVTTICIQTHPIINQSQLASGNHRSTSRRPSLSTSPRGLEIHFLESR